MLTRDDFDAELQRIDDALAALQSISGAAQVDAAHASLLLMRQRIMALIEQYEQDLQSKSALSIQLPGGYTQQQILDAWYQYIDSQHTDPMVPPLIAASWRRCWARVNPLQDVLFPRLKQPYVLSSQVAGFELISISRPVIEDVFQCVANSGTCLLLLNSAGCVLDMIGDPEILRIIEGWGGGVGMILTEDAIGTNSMGLALVERMPVQVAGAEHYVRQFHGASGAAAPIFDPRGNLLGVLGLVMPLEKYHVHSLALVTAAARAIEGQCQADLLLAEQNSQLARLNTVLSAISDGILVWGASGILTHLNAPASQMLNVSIPAVLGKPVETLFSLPQHIIRAIAQRRLLSDDEVTLMIGGQQVNFLVTLNYVFNREDLQWVIMTLRPEMRVRRMVQRQVGASAALTLNDIPGDSLQMQQVRNFVKSAARAKASILIRGETGTGKNVLASAIHNASPRRDGPFVVLACSSVPNELFIQEMLGQDASINSAESRPSKFELAQGGTLYFQDVDYLPIEAQAVLLNVLELGILQRLGGRRPIEVDTRIIASTFADIEKLISRGGFRADLFYRLSTFMITMPPLRERSRDIPLVVERILRRLSSQLGYSVQVTPPVLDVFKRHPWRGNIREVEAVLGRAATQVGAEGVIDLGHLPASVRYLNHLPGDNAIAPDIYSLDEVERETIVRTAQLCRGNMTMMAQALGISRTTLWRRLKTYEIDPGDYRLA